MLLEIDERSYDTQKTKFGTYKLIRLFNRKTFDTNPKKRHNYVHQRVRFEAYLVIEYDWWNEPEYDPAELYFGKGYKFERSDDLQTNVVRSEKIKED